MKLLTKEEFEKSQKAMKTVEAHAERVLDDFNHGRTDADTTRVLLHSLMDAAHRLDVFEYDGDEDQEAHRCIDDQFDVALANPDRCSHLLSPGSSGSMARMFAGYDGNYDDYLYYNGD